MTTDQHFAATLKKAMRKSGFEARSREQWTEAQARVMRNALETIANWPANSNSKPDVMGRAIDAMQALALAALTGHKR